MPGFSQYTAEAALNWTVGKTSFPALPANCYLALLTTAPTDDSGTGLVEVSGGAYARQGINASFAVATGTGPMTITSNANVNFPVATANWGTVVAFAIYDALTNGNLLYWDYLGNYSWAPVTISSASPGVITEKANGYAANDNVVFSTEFGGTAPSFGQSNLTGLLVVVSPATDTFTVTNGGTAVNTSSTGSGMVRKVVTQSVPNGVQVQFASGNIVLSAT